MERSSTPAQRFSLACQSDRFDEAATIAREVGHRPDALGLFLKSDTEMGWRLSTDHPIVRLAMDRLSVDNRQDSEGRSYEGDHALKSEDFRSLFLTLAHLTEQSKGWVRMRLARNAIKRTDVRCDLIEEAPLWFRGASRIREGHTETLFDAFVETFDWQSLTAIRSTHEPFQRPRDETDESIRSFVASCSAAGLITDQAVMLALRSHDDHLAHCVREHIQDDKLHGWRSGKGRTLLLEAISEDRPCHVIERILDWGLDARQACPEANNALIRALHCRGEQLAVLMEKVHWRADEYQSAAGLVHSGHPRCEESRAMLLAGLAREQIRAASELKQGVVAP